MSNKLDMMKEIGIRRTGTRIDTTTTIVSDKVSRSFQSLTTAKNVNMKTRRSTSLQNGRNSVPKTVLKPWLEVYIPL